MTKDCAPQNWQRTGDAVVVLFRLSIFCALLLSDGAAFLWREKFNKENAEYVHISLRDHDGTSRQKRSTEMPENLHFRFKMAGQEMDVRLKRSIAGKETNQDVITDRKNSNFPLFVIENGTISRTPLPAVQSVAVYENDSLGQLFVVRRAQEAANFLLEGVFYDSAMNLYHLIPGIQGYHWINRQDTVVDFQGDYIDNTGASASARTINRSSGESSERERLQPRGPRARLGSLLRMSDGFVRQRLRRQAREQRGKGLAPQLQYEIELFLVADYRDYEQWLHYYNGNATLTTLEMYTYYSFVGNWISQRYRSITNVDPLLQIDVLTTGLLICKSPTDSYWTENRVVFFHRRYTEAGQALDSFRDWIDKQRPSSLPASDHWMLFTGFDLFTDGNMQIAGLAKLGGLCTYDSVSIVEQDKTASVGATAAHELGHSLSARHDGEIKDCRDEDNYVMSRKLRTPDVEKLASRPWQFSTCSVNAFRHFLSNTKCGQIEKRTTNLLTTELKGGQVFSADLQCQLALGKYSFFGRRLQHVDQYHSMCRRLYCAVPGDPYTYQAIFAMEKTTCGDRKWCVQGLCTPDVNAPPAIDACPQGDSPNVQCRRSQCELYPPQFRDIYCCHTCSQVTHPSSNFIYSPAHSAQIIVEKVTAKLGPLLSVVPLTTPAPVSATATSEAPSASPTTTVSTTAAAATSADPRGTAFSHTPAATIKEAAFTDGTSASFPTVSSKTDVSSPPAVSVTSVTDRTSVPPASTSVRGQALPAETIKSALGDVFTTGAHTRHSGLQTAGPMSAPTTLSTAGATLGVSASVATDSAGALSRHEEASASSTTTFSSYTVAANSSVVDQMTAGPSPITNRSLSQAGPAETADLIARSYQVLTTELPQQPTRSSPNQVFRFSSVTSASSTHNQSETASVISVESSQFTAQPGAEEFSKKSGHVTTPAHRHSQIETSSEPSSVNSLSPPTPSTIISAKMVVMVEPLADSFSSEPIFAKETTATPSVKSPLPSLQSAAETRSPNRGKLHSSASSTPSAVYEITLSDVTMLGNSTSRNQDYVVTKVKITASPSPGIIKDFHNSTISHFTAEPTNDVTGFLATLSGQNGDSSKASYTSPPRFSSSPSLIVTQNAAHEQTSITSLKQTFLSHDLRTATTAIPVSTNPAPVMQSAGLQSLKQITERTLSPDIVLRQDFSAGTLLLKEEISPDYIVPAELPGTASQQDYVIPSLFKSAQQVLHLQSISGSASSTAKPVLLPDTVSGRQIDNETTTESPSASFTQTDAKLKQITPVAVLLSSQNSSTGELLHDQNGSRPQLANQQELATLLRQAASIASAEATQLLDQPQILLSALPSANPGAHNMLVSSILEAVGNLPSRPLPTEFKLHAVLGQEPMPQLTSNEGLSASLMTGGSNQDPINGQNLVRFQPSGLDVLNESLLGLTLNNSSIPSAFEYLNPATQAPSDRVTAQILQPNAYYDEHQSAGSLVFQGYLDATQRQTYQPLGSIYNYPNSRFFNSPGNYHGTIRGVGLGLDDSLRSALGLATALSSPAAIEASTAARPPLLSESEAGRNLSFKAIGGENPTPQELVKADNANSSEGVGTYSNLDMPLTSPNSHFTSTPSYTPSSQPSPRPCYALCQLFLEPPLESGNALLDGLSRFFSSRMETTLDRLHHGGQLQQWPQQRLRHVGDLYRLAPSGDRVTAVSTSEYLFPTTWRLAARQGGADRGVGSLSGAEEGRLTESQSRPSAADSPGLNGFVAFRNR